MTRILLIRHGSTDLIGRVLYGRMPGVHLSAEGHRQAKVLGEVLQKRYEVAAVVSSPMERALETATPIAEAGKHVITVDDGIVEIDFGEWIGKSFLELREQDDWQKYNKNRSLCWPPAGESMMEVQARAWRSIESIAERHADEATVAVVTHGDVIRCILLLLLGMSIDHIHRIEVAPASVTEILMGRREPLVRNLNQTFS